MGDRRRDLEVKERLGRDGWEKRGVRQGGSEKRDRKEWKKRAELENEKKENSEKW